jgi:hypothetical protein
MREHYSEIECEVRCPVCDTPFENTEGHIRVRIGDHDESYRLGDALRHRSTAAQDEERRLRAYARVLVFDSDDDYSIWRCRSCGTLCDSPFAEIEQDRIVRVHVMTKEQVEQMLGFDRGLTDIVGFDARLGRWVPED